MAAPVYGGISAVSTSRTPTSVALSGSNTVGIVFVVGTTTTDLITATEWGSGVPMTKIAAIKTPSDRWISAWWVANPASSATITFTGGSFWRSYSLYYTGASQTGQPDSFNTGSITSALSLSIASTVVASDCMFVMGTKGGAGTSAASGVLTNMRVSADEGALAVGDSNGAVGTGSQTGTITQSFAVQNLGGIAFSLAPAVGGGGATRNRLSLLGVS